MNRCPYCAGAGHVIGHDYPDRGNLIRIRCAVCDGAGTLPALTHCDQCGLDFEYPAELHVCRTGPRQLAGSWLEEVREKQGLTEWREDRKS